MNHSDVRKSMADYLEGDLTLNRRALYDAHLDECAECAREIAEMRATIAALRRMPDVEPPPLFVEDVMRRVRLGEADASWLDRVREWTAAAFAPRILAPVSAAMLVGGLVLGTGQVREAIEAQSDLVARHVPVLLGTEPQAGEPSWEVPGAPMAGVGRAGDDRAGAVAVRPGGVPVRPGPITVIRTPGQELFALNEMLDRDPSRRTRFTEWPPVQPLGQPGEPAAAVSVASRPGTVAIGDRLIDPSPAMPRPMTGPSQHLPSADEWLDHLERNPVEFADRMASRTLAEQEHWVDSLARRAVEQGRLDDVIRTLRASRSRAARVLADDFAAAGARFGGATVTARSTD